MRRKSSRIPIREIVAVALLVPVMALFCVRAVMGSSSDRPAHLDLPASVDYYSFKHKDAESVREALAGAPLSGGTLELIMTVNEDDTMYLAIDGRKVTGSLAHSAVWEYGNQYLVTPTPDNEFRAWSATISAPEGGAPHNGSQTWMICFSDYEQKYSRSEWLTLNADGSAVYGHGKFNVFATDARTRKKSEFEGTWRNTLFGGSPATFVEFEKGWLALYTTPRSPQNASRQSNPIPTL